MSLDYPVHCLPAGGYPFAVHADIPQNTRRALADIHIIVHHQYGQLRQFRRGVQILLLQFQEDGHGKPGTLPQPALHLDIAVHHIDDVLGDGHAQSGALNLQRPLVIGPLEGMEYLFHEFRGHTDAVVLKYKLVTAHFLLIGGLLENGNVDLAAVRSVFYRVAHDVDEHLLDTQTVAKHILMGDIVDLHIQFMVVLLDQRLHHGQQILNQFGEIEVLLRKHHLAALYAAHVQHLVDQGQQMTAGHRDLGETVHHPVPVIDMGAGNGRHTDDGVHGCADIVAHLGQEIRLGVIGSLRPLGSKGKQFLLLLLVFDHLIYAADGHGHRLGLSVLRLAGHQRDLAPLAAAVSLFLAVLHIDMFFSCQFTRHIIQAQELLQILPGFLRNAVPSKAFVHSLTVVHGPVVSLDGINHAAAEVLQIQVIDGLVSQGRAGHGALGDAVALDNEFLLRHQLQSLPLLLIVPHPYHHHGHKTHQDQHHTDLVKGVHARQQFGLRDGENGHPAVIQHMIIYIPLMVIHGCNPLQGAVPGLQVNPGQEGIHEFLELLICMLERRLVEEQRPLAVAEIIAGQIGQIHLHIVGLETGETDIHGQEAAAGRNSLKECNHRLAAALLHIGRGYINFPVRLHETCVILLLPGHIRLHIAYGKAVGNSGRTVQNPAVDGNILFPEHLQQPVHKDIESAFQFLQGSPLGLVGLHIVRTQMQEGLESGQIGHLRGRVILDQIAPQFLRVPHYGRPHGYDAYDDNYREHCQRHDIGRQPPEYLSLIDLPHGRLLLYPKLHLILP